MKRKRDELPSFLRGLGAAACLSLGTTWAVAPGPANIAGLLQGNFNSPSVGLSGAPLMNWVPPVRVESMVPSATGQWASASPQENLGLPENFFSPRESSGQGAAPSQGQAVAQSFHLPWMFNGFTPKLPEFQWGIPDAMVQASVRTLADLKKGYQQIERDALGEVAEARINASKGKQ